MRNSMLGVLLVAGALSAQTKPQTHAPGTPRAAVTSSAIPPYKDLKYPAPKPISIPNVATYTLPNGIKLYLVENHELPLVRGFALVRTGNLFDPADKIGLASMTGMVLRTGGTKSKTGDELDVQLENIAASVEAGIQETYGSVSFSCLKENTDEVLGVFHDVLTSPEFRQDKIELAKTGLRAGIARRNDDPHGVAAREFNDIVYGKNTPYGWRVEYATIDRITRDDLAAFYQRYFFPTNVMMGVLGDFSAADMKSKLETVFGDWTAKQPPVPPFPAVTAKPAPGVFLAVKTDVTQTFFAMGHLAGELRDKDYPALEVMADILGDGFRSRLFQRVRTQLGYAYNVGAFWGANFDHPGIFEISGSTKSSTTVATIKVIREELEKIRSSPVTDEELRSAKDTVANSFIFNFDTPGKTLNRMLLYDYYGYPRDFINQYQRAIQAVTREDVLRAARSRLKPEEMAIVSVGNPKEFGEPLATLGLPVTSIDLTIPEPKPEAAKADTASLERGKQLLARAQQAVGGADKLAAVHDATQTVDLQIVQMGGGMKVQQTNLWVSPNFFRQESQLPFGKIVVYSDGKSGWMSTPQGQQALPEAQLKQVREELFRAYFQLLLSDRIAGRTLNSPEPGLLEISDSEGNAVKLFVDAQTGMPAKEIYQSAQLGGPAATTEELLDEFQEIDGLKLPRKITVNQNAAKFAEITVQQYTLNSGLKPEDLSKKP